MDSSDITERLRKRILCKYDKYLAPARAPVTVTFDFILKSFEYVSLCYHQVFIK